jgi:hypothetical protein
MTSARGLLIDAASQYRRTFLSNIQTPSENLSCFLSAPFALLRYSILAVDHELVSCVKIEFALQAQLKSLESAMA